MKESIIAFIDYLQREKAASKNTCLSYQRDLRKLETFLVAQGITEPEVMTVKEAELLLTQPDGDTPKELRDKAMLELLYATGIQITELLTLRLTDVNLCRGYIVCHEGQKDRIVPFGQNAMVSLLRYLHMGRQSLTGENECGEVFVNCKGKGMSRQGFWKLIKYYADKAELETEITPHTLKHSFAAHSMDK